MYLHELLSVVDVAVRHEIHGNIQVLTPSGAVFDNFDTDEMTNMAIAYGALFDDRWEVIDRDEAEVTMAHLGKDKIIELRWVAPLNEQRPLTPLARLEAKGMRVVEDN